MKPINITIHIIYLGIITLLSVSYFSLNTEYTNLEEIYANDSYTRVMDCFRDDVAELEFCKKFYESVK